MSYKLNYTVCTYKLMNQSKMCNVTVIAMCFFYLYTVTNYFKPCILYRQAKLQLISVFGRAFFFCLIRACIL